MNKPIVINQIEIFSELMSYSRLPFWVIKKRLSQISFISFYDK